MQFLLDFIVFFEHSLGTKLKQLAVPDNEFLIKFLQKRLEMLKKTKSPYNQDFAWDVLYEQKNVNKYLLIFWEYSKAPQKFTRKSMNIYC